VVLLRKKTKKNQETFEPPKVSAVIQQTKSRSKHVWNGADIIEVRAVFYA